MREDHSPFRTPEGRKASFSLGEVGAGYCWSSSLIHLRVAVDSEAGAVCPQLGTPLFDVTDAKEYCSSNNGKSSESSRPLSKNADKI